MREKHYGKNQGFYVLIMTTRSSWIILDPPCWVFISVTIPPESFQSSMVFIEVNAWLSIYTWDGNWGQRLNSWKRHSHFFPIDAFIGQLLLSNKFKKMLLFVTWLLDISEGNYDGLFWSCPHRWPKLYDSCVTQFEHHINMTVHLHNSEIRRFCMRTNRIELEGKIRSDFSITFSRLNYFLISFVFWGF